MVPSDRLHFGVGTLLPVQAYFHSLLYLYYTRLNTCPLLPWNALRKHVRSSKFQVLSAWLELLLPFKMDPDSYDSVLTMHVRLCITQTLWLAFKAPTVTQWDVFRQTKFNSLGAYMTLRHLAKA